MNRTKSTAKNAIMQILSIGIQSILALIVTRTIIVEVGSDYNGITSTATQILTFLTLLEGGFTLASLVKLYKPYGENDFTQVNKLLSLSNKIFKRIGLLYLLVGIVISVVYAPFVKTNATYFDVVIITILSVIPSAFNIYYVCKYRLLFQVSQSEYLIYGIQIFVNLLMYSSEILILHLYKNIIYARACVALFQMLNGLIIGMVAKIKFRFARFNINYDRQEILGTKDVFVAKISGLVFSSSSVIFISIFIGTEYTSVYSVYYSVLVLISNIVNAFLLAPRNALGQIFNSNREAMIGKIYNEYELASTMVSSILYSVTFSLIIPFVRLYVGEIKDVNYVDFPLAVLLVLNGIAQMVHVPAGTCLEVSGNFKNVKRIQLLSAVIIILLSIVGAKFWGLYGILVAKLITSIYLIVAEAFSTRCKILRGTLREAIRVNAPSLLVGVLLAIVEYKIALPINMGIVDFVFYASLFTIINTILIVFTNYFLCKNELLALKARIRNLITGR